MQLKGPETDTTAAVVAQSATTEAFAPAAGQCRHDYFTISSPGAPPQPVICGTMQSGTHLYVEMEGGEGLGCAQLSITQGSITATRAWDITISQIICPGDTAPPSGCSQYLTGTTGSFYSLNYGGSQHLAGLDYNMCVRREYGYCKISWTGPTFSWSDKATALKTSSGKGDLQCSATNAGDWVIIPGIGRRCRYAWPATAEETAVRPFGLIVHSDNTEVQSETGVAGFKLDYTQKPVETFFL